MFLLSEKGIEKMNTYIYKLENNKKLSLLINTNSKGVDIK